MPRHVLPYVNERRQAPIRDDESDSSSDSESDDSSDCEQPEQHDEQDDSKEHPEASTTIDEHQQERQELRKSLEPLFQKARKIVKWMLHNHDPYNEFGSVCKKNEWKWKRFSRETKTRWSSQLDMLTSVLYNNFGLLAAHNRVKEKFKSTPPPSCLTHDECVLAQQVCGVLTPFKVATKQMEGNSEKSFASCYLPTWFGIIRALEARIPKPEGAGVWGSEVAKSKYFFEDELIEVPQRLRLWLLNDMREQIRKHIGEDDDDALAVLRAASFLDPRHKRLKFLSEEARELVKKWVERKATAKAEKDPDFKDLVVAAKKVALAKEFA